MEMNVWMQRMDVIISDWGLCKWSVCRFDMWCKSQKDQSWRDHDRNKSAYFRRCLMFLDITFNPHAENKFGLYKKKKRNVLIVLVVMWGHSVLLWLTQGNLRLPSGHWPSLLILVLICKCICLSNLNVITNATWLDEANKCARTTSDGRLAVDRVGCFSIFFSFWNTAGSDMRSSLLLGPSSKWFLYASESTASFWMSNSALFLKTTPN